MRERSLSATVRPMLLKLSNHIAACYERAADARQRAEHTLDAGLKAELLKIERSWTHLARSYEAVEAVERFLLSAYNERKRDRDDPTDSDPGRNA